MITTEQAKEYLSSIGIDNVPDFIIAAWITQITTVEDCLTANYDEGTALLIQCYLLSLFALGSSDKYISSQTAPSGASRSFRYKDFSDRWKAQLNLLKSLDKEGCTTDLIPSDPTQTAFAGIWISKGSCL